MLSIHRSLPPTGCSKDHPPDANVSSWAFSSRPFLAAELLLVFAWLFAQLGCQGEGRINAQRRKDAREEGSAPRCLLALCLRARKWRWQKPPELIEPIIFP